MNKRLFLVLCVILFGCARDTSKTLFEFEARILSESALGSSMSLRRATAWDLFQKLNEPVTSAPSLRGWQTWYDRWEFVDMARALALETGLKSDASPEVVDKVMTLYNGKRRKSLWTQSRFLPHSSGTKDLDEGAQVVMLYSPAAIRHMLMNAAQLADCEPGIAKSVDKNSLPRGEKNFSLCLNSEFPANATIVKSLWFEEGAVYPTFRSDADTLSEIFSKNTFWPVDQKISTPDSGIQLSIEGKRFQLAALHLMTKEIRHWTWATYWWSNTPNDDFGQDRLPMSDESLRHYKMCATTAFDEKDPMPHGDFEEDQPSLARAIEVSSHSNSTWCASPYLERTAPTTNCIGCHQSAPLDPSIVRERVRSNYPSDFLFSLSDFRVVVEVLKPH